MVEAFAMDRVQLQFDPTQGDRAISILLNVWTRAEGTNPEHAADSASRCPRMEAEHEDLLERHSGESVGDAQDEG